MKFYKYGSSGSCILGPGVFLPNTSQHHNHSSEFIDSGLKGAKS